MEATKGFSFQNSGSTTPVHLDRFAEARKIDKNRDGVLSDQEIVDHLVATDAMPHAWEGKACDEAQVLKEFKMHLSKSPNSAREGYHSYDELSAELSGLEQTYPDLAQKVSLGQTAEGRDIWALKISKGVRSQDTSDRPGVVITGGTHSREWMSPEIPLHVAHELLDNYASDEAAQKRVKEGEIWVVPLLNPDGYEYSRGQDNWWRKNRNPVGHDATGAATDAIGVDNDRNYWDGTQEHFNLWRPDGDTAESTDDDYPMTSDDPNSDVYRGPSGASEKETQAILALELGHKNIRGVIDHHSYGDMILYPWGHTSDPVPNQDLFVDIGTKMNAAMNNDFSLGQSAELYPDSGESDDCQYANNITSYIVEVGSSFQPNPSTIKDTCEKVGKANLVFIDEIIDRAKAGTLPPRPTSPPSRP